jgi:N-methylhydantoinase B
MREVLGGGSGGRYYADGEDTIHVVPDSRNIPAEFAEARWPFIVERLGLAVDSGGPGEHRGGLGYDKHIRMLRDAHYMSIADRSILSCWGVNGGRAGRPFRVTIDPGGPRERDMDGLIDAEPVRAGEVIRIRTTGGGGWGDPLDRDPAAVAADVRDGKVSVDAARDDYGVVLIGDEPGGESGGGSGGGPGRESGGASESTSGPGPRPEPQPDLAATTELRARLRAARGPAPFFDRGPGYPRLSGGRPNASVDL